MIWWFLILGVSTLVVVCVAIALYMRLRRHLQAAHAAQELKRQPTGREVSRARLRPELRVEDSETFPWKNRQCKF
jgi:hypothetical protein